MTRNELRAQRHKEMMNRWKTGDVPEKVINVMYFILLETTQGSGVTWAEIAEVGGWAHRPRPQWRNKMKYLKRFGVTWQPNVEFSTCVRPEVVKHLVRLVDKNLVGVGGL